MAVSKVILDGVTQMDVTTDTVTEETLITGYTATKNDGTKINGAATAGGFEVGDILQSLRTDLGTDWALCNGETFDATVYPDLGECIPKKSYPQQNSFFDAAGVSSWQSGFGTVYSLRNSEYAAIILVNQMAGIIDAKGAGRAGYIANNQQGISGTLWGIEHNGSSYVIFTMGTSGSTSPYSRVINVYTTTDFSSFTLAKTVDTGFTTNDTLNYADSYGRFDGTYYYLSATKGSGSSGTYYTFVLNSSYNLVGTLTRTGNQYYYYMVGDKFIEQQVYGAGVSYFRHWSGTTEAKLWTNAYFDDSSAQSNAHILDLNDSYYVAWSTSFQKIILLSKSSTTVTRTNNIGASSPTWVGLNADKTRIQYWYYYDSTHYYCLSASVNSDLTQSVWTSELVTVPTNAFSNWGGATTQWRYNDGIRPHGKYALNLQNLPTISNNECYTYIRISL